MTCSAHHNQALETPRQRPVMRVDSCVRSFELVALKHRSLGSVSMYYLWCGGELEVKVSQQHRHSDDSFHDCKLVPYALPLTTCAAKSQRGEKAKAGACADINKTIHKCISGIRYCSYILIDEEAVCSEKQHCHMQRSTI